MNLHEHQAKTLFKSYDLPTSNFFVANTVEEAKELAKKLNVSKWVVKAQVHAGGRGKAGGVEIVESLDDVEIFAKKWLGKNLITYQTDKNGQPVNSILIEECTEILSELYLGVVVDRSTRSIVVMASSEGGVNIEEVAENNPEKIFKASVKIVEEASDDDAKRLAQGLNLNNEQTKQFIDIFKNLSKLFIEKDLALVEINPLVIDDKNKLKCLDGKVSVDSNALFRHEELMSLRDTSQEEQRELEASKWDLNYVSLEGEIGCMVNGAGLAMGTMDIIKLAGGFPANFLDVGGGVNEKSVSEAFKIILSDQKVKAILINIFGGIVKCDVVAEGIISAVKEVGVDIPVIVRLKGNNANIAQEILTKSDLNIIFEPDLSIAAKKAVELSK
ncbi:ADP-forming succinate--CoA ligase subunit beta [SAR86 cluster bacterium]|nr:ADP-forming succinate--CoA ligase subunit beta [SAR86 cluster bacterium]